MTPPSDQAAPEYELVVFPATEDAQPRPVAVPRGKTPESGALSCGQANGGVRKVVAGAGGPRDDP
jgi:hypothetical protein